MVVWLRKRFVVRLSAAYTTGLRARCVSATEPAHRESARLLAYLARLHPTPPRRRTGTSRSSLTEPLELAPTPPCGHLFLKARGRRPKGSRRGQLREADARSLALQPRLLPVVRPPVGGSAWARAERWTRAPSLSGELAPQALLGEDISEVLRGERNDVAVSLRASPLGRLLSV